MADQNLTQNLIEWDRQYLWHPFTPMKPWIENKDIIVIERGEREFLFDTLGRRYIDGVSSLWCNIHGHHIPELDAALKTQLEKIAHSTLLGLSNVPAILLGKKLVELTHASGLALNKVFYSDNGSTAVEVACKMAYQYWQNLGHPRPKFLALHNSYHGDTLGAVSVGGIPTFHNAFRGLTFPVDFFEAPLASGQGPDLSQAIDKLDRHLAASPNTYAALIIEPLIQGAGGMLIHTPGFLQELRRLADKHNTLLIADEVLTAFGRTGKLFACEHSSVSSSTQHSALSTQHSEGGVTPDFLCLSKGLTAGYMPLGVTMTTQKIFNAFYADPSDVDSGGGVKTFFHGHTFTGHPLACAVALASLELFEKNNLLAHVAHLGPIIDDLLAPLKSHPNVAEVRRLGLIAAIEIVSNKQTREPFPYQWRIGGALCTRMRSLGLMMRPLADVIVIMPPLAIMEENLREMCNAVRQSFDWLPEIITQKKQEFRT